MTLPLEKQVCSLELAKRLKELGVKQDSLYYWRPNYPSYKPGKPFEPYSYDLKNFKNGDANEHSAFTVAELGEMLKRFKGKLPRFDEDESHEETWFWWQGEYGSPHGIFQKSQTEADARAKMLIYLIENKMINPQEEKRG